VSLGTKIAYKPVGMIGGVLAGAMSGLVIRKTWRAIAGEETTPDPLRPDHSFGQVVLAAALQGAETPKRFPTWEVDRDDAVRLRASTVRGYQKLPITV
jgi:hypothetical protein